MMIWASLTTMACPAAVMAVEVPRRRLPRWRQVAMMQGSKLRSAKQSSLKLPPKIPGDLVPCSRFETIKIPQNVFDSWIETIETVALKWLIELFEINLECFKQINHIPIRGGGIGLVPSRELTYPLPRPFWRWFSFSPGTIVPWRVSFRSNGDFQGDQFRITLNHLVGIRVDLFGCSERGSHVPSKIGKQFWQTSVLPSPRSLVSLAWVFLYFCFKEWQTICTWQFFVTFLG